MANGGGDDAGKEARRKSCGVMAAMVRNEKMKRMMVWWRSDDGVMVSDDAE